MGFMTRLAQRGAMFGMDARIALIARAGLERVPRDVMFGSAAVIGLILVMLLVFR